MKSKAHQKAYTDGLRKGREESKEMIRQLQDQLTKALASNIELKEASKR